MVSHLFGPCDVSVLLEIAASGRQIPLDGSYHGVNIGNMGEAFPTDPMEIMFVRNIEQLPFCIVTATKVSEWIR